MADWFVDTSASGGNDGTAVADAWEDYDTALSSTGFAAGDVCWFRRGQSSIPTSNISMNETSTTPSNPIKFLCYPRPSREGTATFTNGSHCVTNMALDDSKWDTADPAVNRLRFMTRLIKNDADGKDYMISAILVKLAWDNDQGAEAPEFEVGDIVEGATSGCWGKVHKVTDNGDGTGTMWLVTYNATTGLPDVFDDGEHLEIGGTYIADADGDGTPDGVFLLDEFAGTTEIDGDITVEADEYYANRPAAAQSAGWDSDDDSVPTVDFNDTSYQWVVANGYSYIIQGFSVKNTTSILGSFSGGGFCEGTLIRMLLLHNKNNVYAMSNLTSSMILDRFVITGLDGAGTNQIGLTITGYVTLKNGAIYGIDDSPVYVMGNFSGEVDNMNLGVELPCGDTIFYASPDAHAKFKNILFSADNGFQGTYPYYGDYKSGFRIENYQKILGKHTTITHVYLTQSNDCSGADINARSGGSSNVLEIENNISDLTGVDLFSHTLFDWLLPNLSAGAHTVKVYVNNTAAINTSDAVDSADLWLEVDYVDSYDDTSEYHISTARSTSSNTPIPARADADDWAEYLTVTFTVATASNVYIRLKSSWYDAGENIYVDLNPDIT